MKLPIYSNWCFHTVTGAICDSCHPSNLRDVCLTNRNAINAAHAHNKSEGQACSVRQQITHRFAKLALPFGRDRFLHAHIIPKHLEASTGASAQPPAKPPLPAAPFLQKKGSGRNPEDGPDSMETTKETHLLFLLLIFLVRGAHITYRHWRVTFDACAHGNGESVNHDGATRGTERRYRDLVHNQATSARELAPAAQRSPTYPCSPELIITSHRFNSEMAPRLNGTDKE